MTHKPIIFVGPTAFGSVVDFSDFDVRPPVKRGDVDRLINSKKIPDKVVIVDGTFHSYPSVGHRELLRLIDWGCQVIGGSSMGAIRATELKRYGMQGFGQIYQRYCSDPDFDDDEVTLIHGSSAPFIPVSEPMVHIRSATISLLADSHLSPQRAERATQIMKQRWFGERTLALFSDTLANEGVESSTIRELLENFDRYRLKRLDLENFISNHSMKQGVQPSADRPF
ncbi:TfuA-like protein [Vibrio ostreicida]|uniref:TfuA-like protein n=1 Tax=Vibrio ostreicida TaxID=526588 RepID=A0ABT8BVH9_9VIBR|nr:TfuA-like protein [Vibrio ostreicida]MDN3610444.1 TfuA-like protein [Vibrio ostreicida]NPD07552.1 hypothetical protein [Vibrio ostreicida]